jgi:phosphatidylglycerol---prolipoprotein diacylglyceryl transferase
MLPYIEMPEISVFGLFSLHIFGLVTAAGLIFTYQFMKARAIQNKLPVDDVTDLYHFLVIAVIIGNHLFDILVYTPSRLLAEGPILLLKFWDGLSSVGGILSGIAVFAWFVRARKIENWLPLFDIAVQGAIFFLIFGRLGCALAHDHPGQLSSSFFAVRFPGGARHDLGLDEFLFLLLVQFPLSVFLNRVRSAPGTQAAAFFLLYGFFRFLADFLRATDLSGADTRYLGLTPAQYTCLGFLAIGYVFLAVAQQRSMKSFIKTRTFFAASVIALASLYFLFARPRQEIVREAATIQRTISSQSLNSSPTGQ